MPFPYTFPFEFGVFRSASASMGLAGQAEAVRVVTRTASASIGVTGVSDRSFVGVRGASAAFSLVGAPGRILSALRSASAALSLVGTPERILGALRSASAALGLVGISARSWIGSRLASATLEAVGVAGRAYIGTREASASLSVVGVSDRSFVGERGASAGFSLVGVADRIKGVLRSASATLGLIGSTDRVLHAFRSPRLPEYKRIVLYSTTVEYGTLEDNTKIYKNEILEVSKDTPAVGTFAVVAGDKITSDKPIGLIDNNKGLSIPPISFKGTEFVFFSNRVQPHTVYLYASDADAVVDYYLDRYESPPPDQTKTVLEGTIETMTLASEGVHRFYCTQPIVMAKLGTTGDYIFVPPASREVIHTFSESRYTTEAGSITSHNNIRFTADVPLSSTQIADGAGYDAEMGMPYDLLGYLYVLTHPISDFAIASIEPNTIQVYHFPAGTWVLWNTYDHSAASPTSPVETEVGAQAGNGTDLGLTPPIKFVGEVPFYLRTNDPANDDEYSAIGFKPIAAELGLVGTTTRSWVGVRPASASVGLSAMANRFFVGARGASASISVTGTASRILHAFRAATASIGAVGTAGRKWIGSRSAAALMGIISSSERKLHAFRDTDASMSQVATATRTLTLTRLASAALTAQGAANRIFNGARSAVASITSSASAMRTLAFERGSSATIGFAATGKRAFEGIRAAFATISIIPPILSDAILIYHMDEGKGDTIHDSSGEGNDGTIFGASWVDGKFGKALNFDGNDYVAIQNLNFASAGAIPKMTVIAVVKIPVDGGDWSILDFDRSEYFTCCAGIPSGVYNGEGDYVGFHTNAGGIHDMWSNGIVRDGLEHTIAWVYDGVDKIIYIDGVEDARITNPHGGVALGSGATRYGFIGDGSEATVFNGNRNNQYYEGMADEVRFYFNHAFNAEEIKILCNLGAQRSWIGGRSAIASITATAAAKRSQILERVQSASVGITAAGKRGFTGVRSAIASVSVAGTAVRRWVGSRSSIASISAVAAAKRSQILARIQGASMGLTAVGGRAFEGVRSAAASMSVNAEGSAFKRIIKGIIKLHLGVKSRVLRRIKKE